MVFVLAVEGNVLGSQMRQVYGESFDSDEYLKKFIDIRFTLEPRVTLNFIKQRFEEFGVNSLLEGKDYWSPKSEDSAYLTLIYYMAVLYDLRPRDVNQIVTKYLLLLVTRNWTQVSPFLVLFLLILDQNSKKSIQYFLNTDNLVDLYENNKSKDLFIPLNEWYSSNNLKYLDNKTQWDLVYIIAFIMQVKREDLGESLLDLINVFGIDINKLQESNLSPAQQWEKEIYQKIYDLNHGFPGTQLLEGAIKYISFTD